MLTHLSVQPSLNPLIITQNKILKILQYKKRKADINDLCKDFKALK